MDDKAAISKLIPVSAVIPTYNRPSPLRATLLSLSKQNFQFAEVIVVDASDDGATKVLMLEEIPGLKSSLVYREALEKGAASQRNEGVSIATQSFIAFMDDDIYMEPFCVERLWMCFERNASTLGVSAMITNQKYLPIGKFTRFMCRLFEKEKHLSYAGKCIGPAWNFLPSDDESLEEYVEVDWLNLGLTIYRRNVMPHPPFQSHFKGYSMMEDLTLSLTVGKSGKLFNARIARIFHDSQPGLHKSNYRKLEEMALLNRYYIMTTVMQRVKARDKLQLLMLEAFKLTSLFINPAEWKKIPAFIVAKIAAIFVIIKERR